jgi:hypothetical protein
MKLLVVYGGFRNMRQYRRITTERIAMSIGIDYVTPNQRIAENDFRSGMHLPDTADGDNTLSIGWTWIAVLLVAALFIVAGYLDQQSATPDTSFDSAHATSPGSNISVPRAPGAEANSADRPSARGY